MPRIDWKKESEQATELHPRTWYRSPLWEHDHMLGATRDHREEGIAWCGRALLLAMNMDNELGGLWISERKSSKCNKCATRQKEWEVRGQ